jgi:hypothetical protein
MDDPSITHKDAPMLWRGKDYLLLHYWRPSC